MEIPGFLGPQARDPARGLAGRRWIADRESVRGWDQWLPGV